MPFGDQSFKGDNIGFLTTEQALADFAYLVKQVKKDYSAQNNTVFAFGGRYNYFRFLLNSGFDLDSAFNLVCFIIL